MRNFPVPTPGLNIYSGAQRDGIIFPSSARSAATFTSNEFFNPVARGVRLFIDITVNGGGTGTLTVTIQGKDPASGNWVDIAASASLSSVATTMLVVAPGVTETANVDIGDPMPVSWRVKAVVGGTGLTASIGGEYLI